MDSELANQIVGNKEFVQRSELAQRKSIVLLKNSEIAGDNTLPLQGELKFYVENIAAQVTDGNGHVVENPGDVDYAIIRLAC